MQKALSFFFISVFLLSLTGSAQAARLQDMKDLKQAYGIVQKIENDEMVVAVYDPEKKELQEETFQLDQETELVIVRPSPEVIEGDEVQISYSEKKNKKLSKFVSIMDLPDVPETGQ